MPVLEALADETLTVEVNDPFGQHQVMLEGVRPSTTANEILAMALAELQLPPNIDWDLRDETTSRLLTEKQPMSGLVTEEAPQVRLTMQPNAGLG